MDLVTTGSDLVLRQHARSFYFASRFLPATRRGPIADLYAFCRYVDDLSDQREPREANALLLNLRQRLEKGLEPMALEFERQGIQRRWLIDLVDGALSDTDFQFFADESALDLYCYQVAGVVGLMMCPLLGVADKVAWQNAVDLGTAMQLTNIARDVAEDAERTRLYIPLTWLKDLGVTPEEAMQGKEAPALVRRLLKKAEGLYRSGEHGLVQIPSGQRGAIAVALTVYRGIGGALARQNDDPFRGRAFVPFWRKIPLALQGLGLAYCPWLFRRNYEGLTHNLSWRTYGFTGSGVRDLCAEGENP